MSADSRLDEYQAEAERLVEEVTQEIPDDLIDEVVITESEARYGETESAEELPSDPAHWQVYRAINLVSEDGASADAAARISRMLADDGWAESRVRETEDGRRIADGFRTTIDGGEWYLELTWVKSAPELAETIEVTIVSPPTVRGDAG
ncbi:hypothetical protein [Microbacterium terricola]|nr:hypothetical protein [Microbacterium terricola]UYK39714.1 hypothetical protein OAU46_13585 [Microbacterium terricola]